MSTVGTTVSRTLVLIGEDEDKQRRGNKKVFARSECRFRCPDDATLKKCVDQIRISDEHLRNRPQERMLWDWQTTYVEKLSPDQEGGVVVLGVAWYDEIFFAEHREAYANPQHLATYLNIGMRKGSISVQHWKLIGEGAL